MDDLKQEYLRNLSSKDFLVNILKIPSNSGEEKEISHFLKQFLQVHDFKILHSNLNNVIGIKGFGKPVLLLASHMDTVPTENPFNEKEGKLYGTGAVDCKPSLASMFYSAAKHDWKENNGTIIVAGIVEEEISTRGILELFNTLERENLTPNYSIFGEPTGENRICIGYRGRIVLDLEVNSEPGHASSIWGFDNSIEISMAIYAKLKDYARNYNLTHSKKDNHFDEISITMTTIKAGETKNSTPGLCKSTFDIRIPPDVKANQLMQTFKFMISEFSLETSIKCDFVENSNLKSSTTVDFNFSPVYNAVEIPKNSLITNALRWAAFKTLKTKISLLKKTGSTFMNLIQNHYKSNKVNDFACIVYGPGNPRLEHTNSEYIEIEEYENTVKIYHKFFEKFVVLFIKMK